MIPNFNASKSLQSFSQKIKESSLFIEKLWGSPKALLLSLALKATGKNLLVLS
ncbi:MAG TPA: hypothetical protein VLG44_02685 [Chlamydiales bacterium]|nr:hypothetical protein [Chlamydiales bacterium]